MKHIQINLHDFLEESFLALNTQNEDDLNDLEDKFIHFYNRQDHNTRVQCLSYMYSNKLVIDNSLLRNFIHKLCLV